jgi:hypothetical protein
MTSEENGNKLRSFTITERDNCILVNGSLTTRWLSAISNMAEGSTFDSDLSRMLGATFAIGLPDDLAALKEKIKPGIIKAATSNLKLPPYNGVQLSEAALVWLAAGERGMSSNAMFKRLTGFNACEHGCSTSHPCDPSDLLRCMKLLEQCPELAPLLPNMRDVSPEWSRLVESWSEITETMLKELVTNVDRNNWSCPKTYDLMKKTLGA